MNKNAIINICGKKYYELLLPVENYNSHSINELRRAIDQNIKIMPISEPQTQVASDTELQDRSTQPATPQNQNITNYSDAEKRLRSISMIDGRKGIPEKKGQDVAGVIIEETAANCIDAATVANVFVEKINVVDYYNKSTVRSTISYIMIELAKLDQSKLAADIITKMVEQGHLEEVIKVLNSIYSNAVMDVLFEILGKLEEAVRIEATGSILRSMSKTNTKSEKIIVNGTKAAKFIVKAFDEKCLDATLTAKVFIERIDEGAARTKFAVRSTIAHSMIELVNRGKYELAADIVSQMVEQGRLDDATRILLHIEHNINSKDAENVSTITKDILSKVEQEIIQKIRDHILDMNCSGHHASDKTRVKEALGLVIKEQEREQAFILATARDAIETLRKGEKNYEDVVDYLLCIACDGGYITGDEEVAAAQEILNAIAYNEPTKNTAVKVLRKMEDIIVDTDNGDEQKFIANILQQLANKLPEE